MNSDTGKGWYGVSATFKAVHVGTNRRRHLWERIFFVVRASDDSDARKVAESVAKEKEHEYSAAGGDTISWQFREIEGIVSLSDDVIGNGTEVYWQFFERVDRTDSRA